MSVQFYSSRLPILKEKLLKDPTNEDLKLLIRFGEVRLKALLERDELTTILPKQPAIPTTAILLFH